MKIPEDYSGIEINGVCHDCGSKIPFRIAPCEDGIMYDGGAIYATPQYLKTKCNKCFKKNPILILDNKEYRKIIILFKKESYDSKRLLPIGW